MDMIVETATTHTHTFGLHFLAWAVFVTVKSQFFASCGFTCCWDDGERSLEVGGFLPGHVPERNFFQVVHLCFYWPILHDGSQVAERLGNRASNLKVASSIHGRVK